MSEPGAPEGAPEAAETIETGPSDRAELGRLRRRVDHLESELEGLQDAVHRENQRRAQELSELRRQVQPEELAKVLSADARRRGI